MNASGTELPCEVAVVHLEKAKGSCHDADIET